MFLYTCYKDLVTRNEWKFKGSGKSELNLCKSKFSIVSVKFEGD